MTQRSVVSHLDVRAKTKAEFLEEVRKVHHVRGEKIFIKPNLLSDQLVPGQCTSPWVLEGLIRTIKEQMPNAKIFVGDADVATSRQVERAAKDWGIKDICKKFGIQFINLSKQSTKKVNIRGEIFKTIDLPKILLDVDCIVTVPVIKSHNVTSMTCSLKNQWGCLPRIRHQYHPHT